MTRSTCRALLLVATVALTAGCAVAQTPWHSGLYLGNDGFWQQRVRIDVTNAQDRPAAGDPVSVTIGKGEGEADLVGALAEALRVCDAKGVEMLWSITDPGGASVTRGPIPAGGQLLIPVECPAQGAAAYYAYFDNPKAWGVPDFFDGATGLRNGGLEDGADGTPSAWGHDTQDEQHQAMWVTENPHGGKHCLKTVVAPGAPATWVASRQHGIRIIGGAKYTMKAWVKAKDVVGQAGWYIHVGNGQNAMIISPMLNGGPGTYDWKEVTAEFTAPADASLSDLGTVLYGTGTAWFDDVSLETGAQMLLPSKASRPERLQVTQAGADAPWLASDAKAGLSFSYRAPVRVMNFTDAPAAGGLTCVDLSGLIARLQRKADDKTLRVMTGGKLAKSCRLADTLLIEAGAVPAHTVQTYYLYLADRKPGTGGPAKPTTEIVGTRNTGTTEDTGEGGGPASTQAIVHSAAGYESIIKSDSNLVKNASFETGDALPTDWPGGAEGEKPAGAVLGFDKPGLFGARCVKIDVPADAKASWTGWRQTIPVQEGHTYLYSAWLKCKDVKEGVQIHAHCRDAKDNVVLFTGAGPAITGTTDWTLLSGMFTMPAGTTSFQIHLTMNTTGTVWHDGVFVTEVSSGQVGELQGRSAAPAAAAGGLSVWSVNPIVKVFEEDAPTGTPFPTRLTVAGNEKEPLQLAVRSATAIKQVKVAVDAPKNAAGAALSDLSIGVVGYVPIDYPTNYYSTNSSTYVRKFPASPAACDGWAGWWPDPLLPHDTFDLAADKTQPVWVTVRVPKGAAPGDYKGQVRLLSGGKTLATVPFSVHVWGFDLPDELHTAAVYDAGLDGRWSVPGQTFEQTRHQFWQFLAEDRICPDRIQPEPIINYKDGKVTADFTEFDKAASYYFDTLHLPHTYTPGIFYMFGWGFPPSEKFGEAPYEGKFPYDDADHRILRPEFRRAVQACLRVYWDHMKAKGWADRVVYYMSDEPPLSSKPTVAQMQALCEMVREVDPAIPIYVSTWGHIPPWDGYINLWGIGHYGIVSEKKIREIRASGARIRYTTDGQMCTDTPYCAIERLLPHYCFKYDVEAYEFWGCSWLTYDPYKYGWHAFIYQSDTPGKSYYVRYPNGDGFIAYPGGPIGNKGPVPSIRMEQAREGVEDYEYLYRLRELVNKAKAAGKDASVGEKALQAANAIVGMPSAGGRYSTKILPDPDVVFRAKEQVARAIEILSK